MSFDKEPKIATIGVGQTSTTEFAKMAMQNDVVIVTTPVEQIAALQTEKIKLEIKSLGFESITDPVLSGKEKRRLRRANERKKRKR